MTSTPPYSKRVYDDLLKDPLPDSPLAVPSKSLPAKGGGVSGLDTAMSGLALGKSVCILIVSSDEQNLCCARVGATGNVFCFLKKDMCTTESHAKQRSNSQSVLSFVPGIYVKKSTSNPNSLQVYGAPVGDLELLEKHREAIMESEVPNPTEWISLFNDWARSESQTQLDARRTMKEKARAIQTPVKRPDPMFSVDAYVTETDNVLEVERFDSFNAGVEEFVELLLNSQEFFDGPALGKLFMTIPFQEIMESVFNRTTEIESAIEQIGNEMGMNRTWNEDGITTTADRVTDLELSVGNSGDDDPIAASVWEAIQALALKMSDLDTRVNELEDQVKVHEQDLESTFQTMQSFKAAADRKSRQLIHRLDSLESNTGGGIDTLEMLEVTSKVEELSNQLAELTKARANDLERIDALEARCGQDLSSVQLEDDILAKSPGDIRAYLTRIGAHHCDLGGFCDVYNVLIRIQAKIDGAGEVGDFLKRRKDARSVELSENEAIVLYSFLDEAPPMFGGDKSEKTDIQSLPTYGKWRNKAKQSGLGYEVQTKMKSVEREIKELISLSFKRHRELSLLAKSVLAMSLEFINKLVEWVDSTYEVLIEGGNSTYDIWNLITKVARALFEEGMAPFRTTPVGTKYSSREEQSSVLLWGILRTHVVTERMMEGDLRDHPVVTGNYAKWLVNNSGKKDALLIKRDVEKLTTKLAKVEEESASKRALSAVEKIAESAKKVADKALAKASA